MSSIIYHITTPQEWEVAINQGFYQAPSLAIEGFIHCATETQIEGVLHRYFSEKNNLIKLVIDTSKLIYPLQYDMSPSLQESFPHIYGVINLDAVVDKIILC